MTVSVTFAELLNHIKCKQCGHILTITRQTEEEVGRQHQGMDRPGVRQVPEGSGEQGKMEKTGCEIICGALMTLMVKGLMMMMMNNVMHSTTEHTSGVIFAKQDNKPCYYY